MEAPFTYSHVIANLSFFLTQDSSPKNDTFVITSDYIIIIYLHLLIVPNP